MELQTVENYSSRTPPLRKGDTPEYHDLKSQPERCTQAYGTILSNARPLLSAVVRHYVYS